MLWNIKQKATNKAKQKGIDKKGWWLPAGKGRRRRVLRVKGDKRIVTGRGYTLCGGSTMQYTDDILMHIGLQS